MVLPRQIPRPWPSTILLLLIPLLSPSVASNKKNVLFFAVDDLRVQLGAARVPGTAKMSTPHLDEMIGKSLFLRKAQVQQAVCSPTRTSILTSRYPDTTRVWDLYSYFRTVGGNFTTIPQFFKEQGYRTIGAGKIFHPGHASGDGLNGSKGDDDLYSWTDPYFHAPNLQYWSGKVRREGCDGCGNSHISVAPDVEAAKPLPDTQIADRAIEVLGDASIKDSPFFLAVGFHKPHLPFVAPSRFFDVYPEEAISLPGDQQPPKNMPTVAWSNWGELRAYLDIDQLHNSGRPGDTLPANVTKALRRAYYASVSFTDYNIGRVLAALEKNGFANNTVVSFWGDHGWQLGEHGEWCKHTNFDLATNAPMFIHVPGKTDHGIETTTPTEYLDLMPTLAETAAGTTIPACPAGDTSHIRLCTHGTSLVPLMNDPTTPVRKAAYSQYPRGYVKPGLETLGIPELEELSGGHGLTGSPGSSACLSKACTMGYSLLTTEGGVEYRYTEWVDFNTKVHGKPDWGRVVGRELYNHHADPLENTNIASSASSTLLSKLSALLKEHPTAT